MIRRIKKDPLLLVDIVLITAIIFFGSSAGFYYALKKFAPTGRNEPLLPLMEIGSEFPLDTAHLLVPDGQSIQLAGRKTLVIFWSPFCRFCKEELPVLIPHLPSEINILGILPPTGASNWKNPVQDFFQQANFSFPTVVDNEGKIYKKCGVKGTPAYIVLDEDRKVIFRHGGTGVEKEKEFWKAIQGEAVPKIN